MKFKFAPTIAELARRETLLEAATLADRETNRLTRLAEEAHEKGNYDLYETIEGEAMVAARIGRLLRQRASRRRRARQPS